MVRSLKLSVSAVGVMIAILISGCQSTKYQPAEDIKRTVTYGEVKRHLLDGKSSQTDVIKYLGSPHNMLLSKDREEVWIYDYHYTSSSSFSNSDSGDATSSKSTNSVIRSEYLTIILAFDANGILKSHEARKGGY